MDLSIIIPIYNTDIDEFKKCLYSVMNIKKIKYEAVIIDDGSEKENSEEYINLINELGMKNIKYYKQNNSGVSSARNLGIEKATGKYIMFVDSDDEIDADKIDAKDFNDTYDIIVYNLVIIGRKKIKVVKPINGDYGIIESNTILRDLVTKCKFYSPCAKLIKKEILKANQIYFDTEIIHGEDAIFNLDILKVNPLIYYTNKNLYLYKYEFNTLSSRWEKRTKKMIRSITYLHNNKIKLNKKLELTSSEISKIYEDTIKKFFIGCMEISNNKDKIEKINQINIELKKLKINKNIIDKKSKIKYQLIINKSVVIISILAKIRKVYLKMK